MAHPDDKAAMRAEAARRRDTLHARTDAGPATAHLLRALGDADPVAGYWPIRSEIDPRPAMAALHARGRRLALPVVERRATPLGFRRYRPGDALVAAGFGVMVPADPTPEVPLVLIVPLLAFDRGGWRLGYGGGFYDRTLARLRAAGPVRAIGLAYAAQEVGAVPRDGHDQRLDLIVTEAGVIAPEGGTCD